MNSEQRNQIGADDSNGLVLKTRQAAALALKELAQSRSAHRCVLHLRGVCRITVPASILFARENRSSSFLKSAISIATLTLCFGSTTVAQPGNRDPLFPGMIRHGLDNRNELSQGYLTVYSATDQFDDGGVLYYAHSSYSIYTTDGK